eukprot:8829150-Pyramimonas_sp.AAC.1
MEEEKAAALYQELQIKGGGAARFKHGLGFQSVGGRGALPTCLPVETRPFYACTDSSLDGGETSVELRTCLRDEQELPAFVPRRDFESGAR